MSLSVSPFPTICDDELRVVFTTLPLHRLAYLKAVSKQWRRVARQTLTSDKWLCTGYASFYDDYHFPMCGGATNLFSRDRMRSALNFRDMRAAIAHNWRCIQLPCPIMRGFEDGDGTWEFGTLHDLGITYDTPDSPVVQEFRMELKSGIYFSPYEMYDAIDPEYLTEVEKKNGRDIHELSQIVLHDIVPLLPDSSRVCGMAGKLPDPGILGSSLGELFDRNKGDFCVSVLRPCGKPVVRRDNRGS